VGHTGNVFQHPADALLLVLPELLCAQVEAQKVFLLLVYEFFKLVQLDLAQQRGDVVYSSARVFEDPLIELVQETEQQYGQESKQKLEYNSQSGLSPS